MVCSRSYNRKNAGLQPKLHQKKRWSVAEATPEKAGLQPSLHQKKLVCSRNYTRKSWSAAEATPENAGL
jgi:hypothetical protein